MRGLAGFEVQYHSLDFGGVEIFLSKFGQSFSSPRQNRRTKNVPMMRSAKVLCARLP